jgi:hypothetical protein
MHAQADANPDPHANADADPHANADADPHANADADPDAYPDADPDGEPEPGSHHGAHCGRRRERVDGPGRSPVWLWLHHQPVTRYEQEDLLARAALLCSVPAITGAEQERRGDRTRR